MNDDTISRQAAIEHLKKRLYGTALNNVTEHPYYEEMADNRVSVWLKEVPSAQPEIVRCKECKWWDKKDGSPVGYCHAAKHGYYSGHWEIEIYRTYKEDFYCADGEREGEE